MKIKLNNHELTITWYTVLYWGLISFFVFYIARDLAYNTAFVDEAIYATVGEEVLRKIFWEDAISWMGGSYLYPVVSALINRQLGLTGVRLFAMLCVLLTGIIAGKVAKKFAGKTAELITLFIFLFLSISLDLAQIGTYDAPSLAFVALSFYFALKSGESEGRRKIDLLFLSSISAGISIIIKYIAVFIIPADMLLLVTLGFKKNPDKSLIENMRAEMKNIIIWLIPIGLMLGYYALLYFEKIVPFFKGGNSSQPDTTYNILSEIVNKANIILLGLVVALVVAFKSKNSYKKWLVYTLFASGSIPLIYHIGFSNIRSLWKHLVFTSFFWTPAVAWPLVKLYKTIRSGYGKNVYYHNLAQFTLTVLIIGILTSMWLNFSKHWRFQRSWPSATPAIEFLETHRKPDDKIFAEASAIYKYHLFTGFEDPSSWSSTWYFEYKGEFGLPAMRKAIQDRYFAYVILNHYFTNYLDSQLEEELYKYYKVTLEYNYKVSGVYDNPTVIWEPK